MARGATSTRCMLRRGNALARRGDHSLRGWGAVSVAMAIRRSLRGQFVTDVRHLPGRPCDGYKLPRVLQEVEKSTNEELLRIVVDQGNRRPRCTREIQWDAHAAVQWRGVIPVFQKELKRRKAAESIIGHVGNELEQDAIFLLMFKVMPSMRCVRR